MDIENITDAKLTVITNDEATEIFIINSQFHRVDSSAGERATFTLPAGLYTVKIRAGIESREQSVFLNKDKTVEFSPIEFSSAAPLDGTSKTHEYHMANADSESKVVHVHLGPGSSIYLFVRNWTSKTPPSGVTFPDQHPAKNLTLRDRNDTILVDFEKSSVLSDNNFDSWAACNVELAPGTYCLCQQLSDQETMKQSITVCNGWQTQIFLLQNIITEAEKNQPTGISNAAVFMARQGMGFQSQKKRDKYDGLPDFRLTEMVRQALISDRNVINDKVLMNMLEEKMSNPMLGIYGAHLLFLSKKDNSDLTKTVVTNLRRMLNTPHPDVEAMAIKLGMPSDYIFDMPPMLRRSWNFMLEASITNAGLVPETSLVSDVAGRLWCEDLWLVWGEPYEDAESSNNMLVQEMVKQINLSNPKDNSFESLKTFNLTKNEGSTSLANLYNFTELENYSLRSEPGEAGSADIKSMVQSLGMPRAKIETLLKKNNIKLEKADMNLPQYPTNNDEQNQWCFEWLAEKPFTTEAERAVGVKASLWPTGANISVSFLDGDPEVQERVKKAALQWVAPGMANLRLIFRNDTTNTDIRISFKFPGSWSTVGTTCKLVTDKTRPTMNYGWLKKTSTDTELEKVVLHEFGHALGLTHEHLHPEHGIKWNKEQIISDLSGPPNNWKPETIENNMFKVYTKNETNFTAFDKDSIMLYPIPAKWTTDGFSVRSNSKLSQTDIDFIRQQYP